MIETERLILRPWRETDAAALFKYASDPDIGPVAGWPPHTSIANSLEIIRTVFAAPETYAVILKDTDEPVGSCGIMFSDSLHSAEMQQCEAEIGYWIGKPYWGQGLIPEAVRALLSRCFADLHLNIVWCGHYDGNTKSKRVIEKCGFKFHHTNKDIISPLGDKRTEHFYVMTKEDYNIKTLRQTMSILPDPDIIFPVRDCETVAYVKPTVKNPNIIVGEFTYFSDTDFEKNVLHHYDFNGDRLVIGKFCQIASGVRFIMNGANHQMNSVSTYPFYIMEGWSETPPAAEDLPLKGDTVVGNDVWIGQDATILPGVHIGDGAIIGLGSIVGHDVEPYTIVAGNPAKVIRKRFDDELIGLLQKLQWWNKSISEIRQLIPLLTDGDLTQVKKVIIKILKSNG